MLSGNFEILTQVIKTKIPSKRFPVLAMRGIKIYNFHKRETDYH